MQQNGLFRVYNKKLDKYRLSGTAFAVARDMEDTRTFYLLTAYHVVSEAAARGHSILLRSLEVSSEFFVADIFWMPEYIDGYNFGYDFALLRVRFDSNVDINLFKIKSYNAHLSLAVWGASEYSPASVYPEYQLISVSSHSLENILHQDETGAGEKEPFKSIVMTINYSGNVNTIHGGLFQQLLAQDLLGGFSGAPIIEEDGASFNCVGLISNVEADTAASRIYGVSADTIIERGLQPLGLFHLYPTNIALNEYLGYADISARYELLVDSVIGDVDEFTLEESNVENRLWDMFSNLFYAGHPIDIMLEYGINKSDASRYPVDVVVALRYFLARFYFKRGKMESALKEFAHLRRYERLVSGDVWKRLNALMASRTLVERPMVMPKAGLDSMLRIGELLDNLNNIDNAYKAYENASMIGRGLTNLFIKETKFSATEETQIEELYGRHSALLIEYPSKLRKQDVVNTSISWLINLWQISGVLDISLLICDVKKGFSQATVRKNSIFHIQSMLAWSISKLVSQDYFNGLVLLFLVERLMRLKKLSMKHEGISQLLSYLEINYANYFGMFKLTANSDSYSQRLIEKLNLYRSNLSNRQLSLAFDLAHSTYASLYGISTELYRTNESEIALLLN